MRKTCATKRLEIQNTTASDFAKCKWLFLMVYLKLWSKTRSRKDEAGQRKSAKRAG